MRTGYSSYLRGWVSAQALCIGGSGLIAWAGAWAEPFTLDGFGEGSNVVISVNGQELGRQPCGFEFEPGEHYTIRYRCWTQKGTELEGQIGPMLFADPAAFAALPEPDWVADPAAAKKRYPRQTVIVAKGGGKALSTAIHNAQVFGRPALAEALLGDVPGDQPTVLEGSRTLECYWRKGEDGTYVAHVLLGVEDPGAPPAAEPAAPLAAVPPGVPAWLVQPASCAKEPGHYVAFGATELQKNALEPKHFDRAKARAQGEQVTMARLELHRNRDAGGRGKGLGRMVSASFTEGQQQLGFMLLREPDGTTVLFSALSGPPARPVASPQPPVHGPSHGAPKPLDEGGR